MSATFSSARRARVADPLVRVRRRRVASCATCSAALSAGEGVVRHLVELGGPATLCESCARPTLRSVERFPDPPL